MAEDNARWQRMNDQRWRRLLAEVAGLGLGAIVSYIAAAQIVGVPGNGLDWWHIAIMVGSLVLMIASSISGIIDLIDHLSDDPPLPGDNR